jgi:5'-deoxynucleotidase YfbR-like HD superfamily hydrolase
MINTDYENIYWLKRMGSTIRYHGTNPLTHPETVFHHSASVMLILLQTVPAQCSVNLLIAALVHDLPEGVVGDIPAPTKLILDNLLLNQMEENVLKHLRLATPELTQEEKVFLEMQIELML